MKRRVYLETTIPSYLTALPSHDLILAAHQRITRDWWDRRDRFELYVSDLVIREAGAGGEKAAARRLQAVEEASVLPLSAQATAVARALVEEGPLPEKAAVDALHIGIAVTNGMDYLLTWNCTHIANAAMRSRIEAVCRSRGYEPPVICTPEELMEGDENV